MKLYKKTLIICAILFLFATAMSIFFNCYYYIDWVKFDWFVFDDSTWVPFIINWSVGIACSTALVLVTTFIQFKTEQINRANKILSYIGEILFRNSFYYAIIKRIELNVDTVDSVISSRNNWEKVVTVYMKKICTELNELEMLKCSMPISILAKQAENFFVRECNISNLPYEQQSLILKSEFHKTEQEFIKIANSFISLKIKTKNYEKIKKCLNSHSNQTTT